MIINKISTEETLKPKKRTWVTVLIVIFAILLLTFGLLLKTGYLQVISDIFSITGNKLQTTKQAKSVKIKYDPTNQYTNILLLGSDTDAKFNPNSILTQTIMIVSINPKLKKVYMISIPRDFWIQIPGYGYGKFDQVSEIGGIQLTKQLVEQYFGIKIDYYGWIGLSGFVNLINTFGGIYIVPTHPVLDWSYPNDIPMTNPEVKNANCTNSSQSCPADYALNLFISGGAQYMSGVTALEYVRSRHGDLQGDFGRSSRQQQVLQVLKSKFGSENLISEVPSLFNTLSKIVKTDMSLTEVLSLAVDAIHIPSGNIQTIVLSPPQYSTIPQGLVDGQSVVEPNWTAINNLFSKLYPHG